MGIVIAGERAATDFIQTSVDIIEKGTPLYILNGNQTDYLKKCLKEHISWRENAMRA